MRFDCHLLDMYRMTVSYTQPFILKDQTYKAMITTSTNEDILKQRNPQQLGFYYCDQNKL